MLAPNDPLYMRAQQRYGRKCPCCLRTMEKLQQKRKGRHTALSMTKGHDRPKAFGGRAWLYICFECNQDQASRTFWQWAHSLVHLGDYRAEHVMELVRWLRERT